MANESKVVITQNSNKHASRLAKSLQQINNLEDYTLMPEGVWGSTATIKCGNVTIKSSELDFEFDIPFDDNLEANEGDITVYNLSDNTIKQLKAKENITIEAGYEGDTGVIFKGYITKVSTHRDGADKVTEIKVADGIKEKKSKNQSYSSGTKASDILKDLLFETGLPIAKIEISSDYAHENDVTIDESLESAISEQSEICGVSTFVSNGKLYCCRLDGVVDNIFDHSFLISESTGMIGSPSPFEETSKVGGEEKIIKGYDVEMLLQHKISAGAFVRLSTNDFNLTFHVKSGNHIFNESECVTKIKVV